MSARNQDGKVGRTGRRHLPALCRSGAGVNWRTQPGRPLWGILKGGVYGPLEPWVRCSGISGGFLDTFLTPKKYRPPPLEWGMARFEMAKGKGERRRGCQFPRLGHWPPFALGGLFEVGNGEQERRQPSPPSGRL